MACEKCWNDAYVRSLSNGKSQADNYADLLAERADTPCGPEWESENYFKMQRERAEES